MSDIGAVLHDTLGFGGFRGQQQAIIERTVAAGPGLRLFAFDEAHGDHKRLRDHRR